MRWLPPLAHKGEGGQSHSPCNTKQKEIHSILILNKRGRRTDSSLSLKRKKREIHKENGMDFPLPSLRRRFLFNKQLDGHPLIFNEGRWNGPSIWLTKERDSNPILNLIKRRRRYIPLFQKTGRTFTILPNKNGMGFPLSFPFFFVKRE